MTDVGYVLRQVCDHIGLWDGAPCPFLPESREMGRGLFGGKKLPAGAVVTVAGEARSKVYVDGSGAGEVPLAVVFVTGTEPEEGLVALETLDALSRRLEKFAPAADGGVSYGCCRRTGLPVRETEKNGNAVYRMTFAVPWRQAVEYGKE